VREVKTTAITVEELKNIKAYSVVEGSQHRSWSPPQVAVLEPYDPCQRWLYSRSEFQTECHSTRPTTDARRDLETIYPNRVD
jgi:hypothetical protein